jgi:hypothetical protein
LFLLVVGVLLIIVGINNRLSDLSDLIKDDFSSSGPNASFQVWALAIILVGSLGYISSFRPVANAMLALVIVVLLLSHEGFITKFKTALEGK